MDAAVLTKYSSNSADDSLPSEFSSILWSSFCTKAAFSLSASGVPSG